MKYSKSGTLYDLRRCGDDWVVVSFTNNCFGREIGKGSKSAMVAFYEALTDGGEYAAVMFDEDSWFCMPNRVIERTMITKLVNYLDNHHASLWKGYSKSLDLLAKKKASQKKQSYIDKAIPSQSKPSCELGKAQKDFLKRLALPSGVFTEEDGGNSSISSSSDDSSTINSYGGGCGYED